MTVKVISRKLDARDVFIKLVDGSTIRGKVNLYSDEHMIQRVSDIFTKIPDPFITVFAATVEGETGRCVIINKSNIVWVSPEECPIFPVEEKTEPKPEEERDKMEQVPPRPV
jgi:small nuclear ribonucleoprotein (snRNP)-like protein